MEYDLICIGCGPAGEKAATQASYFGRKVAVVEARPRPGGAMVNTGTLPSKTLRETALLCSAHRRRPLPGSTFTIDHDLSVAQFMAYRHRIEQEEHDRIETSMDHHQIDVVRGWGRLLDPHTVHVRREDETTIDLQGRFILIATGSSPLRPANIPFDHPGVVDADGVLELSRLPRSMVIVGAGVIGCEYASVFSEIGVEVTLVNPRQEILPFLDPECRDHLVRAMQERGIVLRLGASVTAVRPREERHVTVELDGGSHLNAETLLWAAGRQSNSTGLGLDAIGVEMGERGLIRVNQKYRTNVPSIYAAGDVIGFPALAATSMEQGRIAACDMFGICFKEGLAEVMPIGLYTIPAVSMVGRSAEEASAAGRSVVVGRALYRHNARGRMLGDEQGLLKCVFDRATGELLGAGIVGEQATELIHLAQSIIAFHGGLDDLIGACFNYPSLTELYKYAAYDALQSMATDKQQAAA